jgi:hypothetical protein
MTRDTSRMDGLAECARAAVSLSSPLTTFRYTVFRPVPTWP